MINTKRRTYQLPSPIEFPVVEVFDHVPKSTFRHNAEVPPSFSNPFIKFLEGLESRYDMGIVSIFLLVVLAFWKYRGVREVLQISIGIEDSPWLMLFISILERPPGNFFDVHRVPNHWNC